MGSRRSGGYPASLITIQAAPDARFAHHAAADMPVASLARRLL
jgi:hypothetical protein